MDNPLPIDFAHKTYRYPVGRKRPRPRSDSPCGRPGKRRREAGAVDALLSLGEDRGSRLEEGKVGFAGSCAPSPAVDSHLPSPSVDSTPIATTARAQAITNCAATVTAVDHVEDGAERVRGKSCAVTTCDNCARLALEIELLKLERTKPKLAVSHFGVERLAADEEQCKYYTGLPSYDVFKSLFNAPTPHLHEGQKSSNADTQPGRERRLSMADELFMVLMRLRMGRGLQVKDLMYRFGFSSASHISTIFRRWILFLAKHLSPLIAWRSRKRVKITYPRCSEQQKWPPSVEFWTALNTKLKLLHRFLWTRWPILITRAVMQSRFFSGSHQMDLLVSFRWHILGQSLTMPSLWSLAF